MQDKEHRGSMHRALTPSTDATSQDGDEAQHVSQQSHERVRHAEYESRICEARPCYRDCPAQTEVTYCGGASSGGYGRKPAKDHHVAGGVDAVAAKAAREI